MKIGSVRSHFRVGFGFGSSRSARRSSSGPAFGPGAAIIVRRLAMLGRADCRASAARRVNTREKSIALFLKCLFGVFFSWWLDWGVERLRKKRVSNKTNRFDLSTSLPPPTVEAYNAFVLVLRF